MRICLITQILGQILDHTLWSKVSFIRYEMILELLSRLEVEEEYTDRLARIKDFEINNFYVYKF